ncbi:MAG TPA: DUF3565 domain-containing protein [Steroidobacteraceae bacterium]|jgi:hypothetical protein
MQRRIVDYHQDEEAYWVAELECGHQQHVRHNPPWFVRVWVTTPEGRSKAIGTTLECRRCDESPDNPLASA